MASYPPTQTNDPDGDRKHVRSGLEEYERSLEGRPPWLLTTTEAKLLGIAGVGFFLDGACFFCDDQITHSNILLSVRPVHNQCRQSNNEILVPIDNVSIQPVCTMLQYRLYGGANLPANLQGFVKAGANIGSVIGQFLFGYLADALGRRRVYGKELLLIIIATILCLTTPTGSISPNSSLIYLGIFRILLGVGVGGDYPMSATVSSDRSSIRRRGTMLAYIFANQGWGSFVGSIATMIVLLCYKSVMQEGKTSRVDGAWRIVVGLSLIPAFGTLYQRLTLPEAKRFEAAQELDEEDDELKREKKAQMNEDAARSRAEKGDDATSGSGSSSPTSSSSPKSSAKKGAIPPEQVIEGEQGIGARELARRKKSHFREFLTYFSEWRHAKVLIGTCSCWFFLDVAFYGINLNQNVVLQQIGFDGSEGTPWEKLFKIATGNLIITALGFVPGKNFLISKNGPVTY